MTIFISHQRGVAFLVREEKRPKTGNRRKKATRKKRLKTFLAMNV
jgi:hypothetical protein